MKPNPLLRRSLCRCGSEALAREDAAHGAGVGDAAAVRWTVSASPSTRPTPTRGWPWWRTGATSWAAGLGTGRARAAGGYGRARAPDTPFEAAVARLCRRRLLPGLGLRLEDPPYRARFQPDPVSEHLHRGAAAA